MTDALAGWTLRPCGEDAFVIEFGDVIDGAVGMRVGALARALDAAAPKGVVEVMPTFRSLLIVYDPEETTREAILAALPSGSENAGEARTHWRIPVCLEGAVAEDLAEAAGVLGLGEDDVRARFLASPLQVGMYGFAPGFAYCSGLDPTLAIPRRPSPRPPMPAGSVVIAGGMAALNSAALPTGWYVIGATALTMFRPDRDPMVPFAVGDRLTFTAVPEAERVRLSAREDGGAERIRP